MSTNIMSEDERKEILDWIEANKYNFLPVNANHLSHVILEHPNEVITTTSYLSDGVNTMNFLYIQQLEHYKNNTRISPYDPKLPACIWKIKQRIVEREKLHGYKQEPIFQDFITIIPPTGYLHKHIDRTEGNLIHCRFNVFIQTPTKGGETYYNNRLVESKEGSYVFCKSGLEEHYTNIVEEGYRITISFGFLIPREIVDTMKSVDMNSETHFPDFSVIHNQHKKFIHISPPMKNTLTHFDLFKNIKET